MNVTLRKTVRCLAFFALMLTVGCARGSSEVSPAQPSVAGSIGTSSVNQTPLPSDLAGAGEVRAPTLSEANGAISRDHAIAAANAKGYRLPNADAFLVMLTDSSGGIDNRLSWIVRFTDINWQKSGPMPATGTPEITTYQRACVVIDGKSGQFTVATYAE